MGRGGSRPSVAIDRADYAFDVLAHRRRRTILRVLDAREGTQTLADLAKALAVLESDVPIDAVEGSLVERIYLGLHHVHVPKLVDAEAVAYDGRRNAVGLTDQGRRLAVPRSDRRRRSRGSPSERAR